MDPASQSIIGNRTFPPGGTFEHWQAAPLRIALSLVTGQTLAGALEIIVEIHSSQTVAATPLAALTHTLVDFDGPWTLDFTAAEMNQTVPESRTFRDLWLVIVALYADGRLEPLATRSIKLHRSNYSGTVAAPPDVTQATLASLTAELAAVEARVTELEELVPVEAVTVSISQLTPSDPPYRIMLNAVPVSVALVAAGSLAGLDFYFEMGNYGRVTFTLPSSSTWELPERALPIMNGKGSIVRVSQISGGRWRIEEVAAGALLRMDAKGYHPVMESGLKLWCEVPYGIAQTRITQADTARATHWPCRAGSADYLHHVGTDPGSTAMKVVADVTFPGGFALQQRTSGGITGFLTSSFVPSSKQYTIITVYRNTALGTTGIVFRTKSDNTECCTYLNGVYLIQPLPPTSYTTGSLQVGGDVMAVGTVSLSAGAATFTHPQDEHLAVGDYILIANTSYVLTARASSTAWTVSPANTDATSRPFIRRPGYERTATPRILVWASAQETGTATSATATTLVDTTKKWPVSAWISSRVVIVSGTGAGQSVAITASAATSLTVASWGTQPDATSTYRIEAVQTWQSGAESVVEMQKPASLAGMPIPSELVFTGGWALNLYAVLVFDGVLTNRAALLRWLAERYPFTLL